MDQTIFERWELYVETDSSFMLKKLNNLSINGLLYLNFRLSFPKVLVHEWNQTKYPLLSEDILLVENLIHDAFDVHTNDATFLFELFMSSNTSFLLRQMHSQDIQNI